MGYISLDKLNVVKCQTFWLNRIIKKYELPRITPHVFRHTHTSLLLQAGIPVKEVCDRLGDKDISITLGIYAHVMPEEKEKTAEKFANFVNFFTKIQTKEQTFPNFLTLDRLESRCYKLSRRNFFRVK